MGQGGKRERRRQPYSSISIPKPLLDQIERLVTQMGYWPTKTAFVREACLEKMEKYLHKLEAEEKVP